MNTVRTRCVWEPFVPHVTDKLFPLVDRMYAQEGRLLAANIATFKIDQEFIATICNDDSAVKEQRDLEMFMAKFEMSHQSYRREEFDHELADRKKREKETGHKWEVYPTTYLRRFHRMRFETPQDLQKLQGAFNIRVADAWHRETALHHGEEYTFHKPDNIDTRVTLVRHILDKHKVPTGLEFDRKLTRRSVLVYSRRLFAQWAIFVAIDVPQLRLPVEPQRPVQENGAVLRRRGGPRLVLCFGVVNHNTRRALSIDNPEALVLRYEWFLPIRKAPLWSDYSTFYSLCELEALLNIHLALYQIVAFDIEDAIRSGLC